MKSILSLLFVSFFISLSAYSQEIKGKVSNEENESLPGVSIYIQELKQGLITNENGEFQIKVVPGNYHLEVRLMTYETQSLPVQVNENMDAELNIVMKTRYIQLKEVEITPGKDRAYEIMRQAIKKAPYYQNLIKSARYESYSKGSGKYTDVPGLLQSAASKEDKEKIELYRDKLFLEEALCEFIYTAPDKYEQTVKAFSSTMPFDNDPKSAFRVGMISMYYPMWGGAISPFNPKAFSYYNFRYEGYEEENGQIINIIRIIPKLKDPKLMKGVIHIADEDWDLRYADITTHKMGMDVHYIFNFHPVQEGVYLVTNFESNFKVSILGFKFHADFLSSVQYHDIELNQTGEEFISDGKTSPEKKTLELKYDDRPVSVDSLALKRDSLFWSNIRSVALSEEEKYSYQYKDTLRQQQDSLDNKTYNPKFSPMDILMGGSIGNDSSLMYFRYNGLLSGFVKEYNFVDGLWMGQSFELDFKKRRNTGIIIKPEVYWTSARKDLVWRTNASIDYAPLRLGRLLLSAESTSEDFSGQAGIDRFLNTLFSSIEGRNHARFYQSDLVKFANQIDIANGVQLSIGGQYGKVTELNNHTTWNLFGAKHKWNVNTPDYEGDMNIDYNYRANAFMSLKYTPEYYYRIDKGKKYYEKSRFPTFELHYQYGFHPDIVESNSHYNQLEFSVDQTIRLDYFNRFNYKLITGKFFSPDNQAFSFVDYKHFNRGGPWLTFKSSDDSYVLLPYYRYSTNKEWFEAFANYNTDYLLLKRLPFLQGKMFTETLQTKYLYTPDKKHYTEWGYSVDLPMGIGGAGVFVSFDSFDYNSVGLQFFIPLLRGEKGSRSITVAF